MKIPPLRGGDFQAVGLAYYNGQGVPKDYAEVAKWHRKAAEQGAMDAQYNLAQLYLFGEGVTQDNAEAAKWWRKAADQGYGAVPNLILASRITMATGRAKISGKESERHCTLDLGFFCIL
jgi:TPR repeat protein